MGRANETRTRMGCPFPSIDRGVSDSLAPRSLVSPGPRLLFARLDIRFGDPSVPWGSLARRPRPKTVGPGRPRDFGPGLSQYSLNVSRCSGIVVISVFRGRAPKARWEMFMTTETSIGKPSRVPEGPFWGAVCLSVERAPGALSEKASMRDRGVPAHVKVNSHGLVDPARLQEARASRLDELAVQESKLARVSRPDKVARGTREVARRACVAGK
ncbi:hypothetical protein CRG98_034694 [Punica granatum]|uniref:Uncharacterized protein n=1 Tax=Punica granatum TaxID=22663 RepID=A0A2I0ILN4_PUNGR|nr:hypothetical protein CRG98_034694 [Punica granatum]